MSGGSKKADVIYEIHTWNAQTCHPSPSFASFSNNKNVNG